ncbi:MAG: BlaI/MecI/CopY family transcriptional regulator [Candidatus Thermoplasmatota archaeon]
MESPLGPLEATLLALLRRSGPALASDLVAALHAQGRPGTYATVNTVLRRMHARGLVMRQKVPHRGAFRYQYASAGREEELRRAIEDHANALVEALSVGVLPRPLSGVNAVGRRAARSAYSFRAVV